MSACAARAIGATSAAWKGRRHLPPRGDGEHAEVVIEGRVYRVRIAELR